MAALHANAATIRRSPSSTAGRRTIRSDLPPALRALLDVGGALLQRSSTGRILLGRVDGIVAPALVPAPLERFAATLARAREEASVPLAPKQVERALRDAWGRAPARVLDDLDVGEPVAVTPVAQVHRAELDGEAVAVKVLRPGLDAAVRSDFALLDALRPPLAVALPRVDGGALLARIREQALDELDLEHEAAQQRAVGRVLRGVEGVVVPVAHTDLAATGVSVSGWLEGPSLAERPAADPSAAARALVTAHVEAARAGLVLIDPRPSHVIHLRDGRIGLLGAGTAVACDRGRMRGLLALPGALRDPDPAPFTALVADQLALLPDPARALEAHGLLRDVLGPVLAGSAPHGRRAAAARARADRRRVRAARGGDAGPWRPLARPRDGPARRRPRRPRRGRGLGRARRLTAGSSRGRLGP